MIHLIVGNTGAGKSTFALQLKKEKSAILFSLDAWNKILFYPDKKEEDALEWSLERIERAELLMQDLILQLENAGVDSVLDVGLSKFLHREKYRKFASRNNLETNLYFLDASKEVRRNRITKRNLEQGETFQFKVGAKDFDFMETWFEAPIAEELETAVIIKN